MRRSSSGASTGASVGARGMSRAGRRLSLPLALTHGCRRRGSLGGPGTPLASSPRSAASAFGTPQIFSIPDAASDAPSVVPSSPSKKNAGQRSILAKLMGHRGSFQASVSSSAHESVLAPLQSEDAADAHDAPLEPIVPPGERIALDPVSAPRCRWDLFIVCCVLYNAVVLPFRLGFGDDTFGPLSILDCLIDVMFLVDIWLNMNTGFIPDGGGPPERRLRVARRRYLRQMFVVDLVSSVPADLPLLLDVGGDTRTRMTLRLPRLLRLLRLPRLFRYARRWILYTGSERATQVLHAIKIASGIILFPHLDACVLFFLQALQDFPETGWVSCEGLEDASKIHQYTYALFIATSHMLCIGYGPPCYSPATSVELGITIGSMIVGASLYIMLIASISSSFLERSVQVRATLASAPRGRRSHSVGLAHAPPPPPPPPPRHSLTLPASHQRRSSTLSCFLGEIVVTARGRAPPTRSPLRGSPPLRMQRSSHRHSARQARGAAASQCLPRSRRRPYQTTSAAVHSRALRLSWTSSHQYSRAFRPTCTPSPPVHSRHTPSGRRQLTTLCLAGHLSAQLSRRSPPPSRVR